MSPVQTRSRKSSVLLAAPTAKDMVLLKQTSRVGSNALHLCRKDATAPGPKVACSKSGPIAIPMNRARSISTSSASSTSRNAVAAAMKKDGQVRTCDHDAEENEQRAEWGLHVENVCSMSNSSRYAITVSANDVDGCVSLPSEWWDEESCTTPKAMEFRIPEEACLACPPAPRKRKAEHFHTAPSFLSRSPPLLPHYLDIDMFLSASFP